MIDDELSPDRVRALMLLPAVPGEGTIDLATVMRLGNRRRTRRRVLLASSALAGSLIISTGTLYAIHLIDARGETSPASPTSPVGSAPAASVNYSTCAGHFTHVLATQTASLGELRSAGPRTLNTPDRFRSLPDDTSVTECLVPLANDFGVFIVYPDGQTQQFSTQNVADKIVAVS